MEDVGRWAGGVGCPAGPAPTAGRRHTEGAQHQGPANAQPSRAHPAAPPAPPSPAHLGLPQVLAPAPPQEPRFGAAAEVEHDLQQLGAVRVGRDAVPDVFGQHL